jgi:hypothetical protein
VENGRHQELLVVVVEKRIVRGVQFIMLSLSLLQMKAETLH